MSAGVGRSLGEARFYCLGFQPQRGVLRFSLVRFVSPMRDSPVPIDATQFVPSPSRKVISHD